MRWGLESYIRRRPCRHNARTRFEAFSVSTPVPFSFLKRQVIERFCFAIPRFLVVGQTGFLTVMLNERGGYVK